MTALAPMLFTGPLAPVVAWATDPDPDPAPTDNAVKAGWLAFAIFLILIAAVVVLCMSFVKQIRKTRAAQERGVFGPYEGPDGGGAEGADGAGGADGPGTAGPEQPAGTGGPGPSGGSDTGPTR
jgi:hypothetical protein